MRLNALQRHLERIYEVASPGDVEDFLVTDPGVARDLDAEHEAVPREEKLLVREEADGMSVSLYLRRELVQRLQADDPLERLHAGNLADLCTALEGVSHFLFLTWSAAHGREVTLLDMETQAEVDKYVAAAFHFASQTNGTVPSRLHQWLFDEPTFHRDLDAAALARYRQANHTASSYCSHIENRYLRAHRHGALLNDLRRFYRLPPGARARRVGE